MNKLFVLVLVFISALTYAQENTKPTSSFTIKGEVKASKTITIQDFSKFAEKEIGDVVITNHLGEKKSEQKSLKGILLKDVLQGVEINSESPKVLSEYYLVCRATDGYKVVFSWNELFNSPTGDKVYLVTSKGGKKASEMEESILMISPADFKTGRRFVKSLETIEIYRAPK